MPNPVVHFEVLGDNGPALRSFYSDLFDWEISEIDDGEMDYGIVSAGDDGGIGGGIGSGMPDSPGFVTFYVSVPDLQAYLDRAESLGGATMMPPTEVPGGGEIAIFSDPEGHPIGLFHVTG